jgi:hypothetical protein
MSTSGKFPKAYSDTVAVDRGLMEYVEFEKMDIGARPSAQPKGNVNEIKSLEHVGNDGSRGSAARAK